MLIKKKWKKVPWKRNRAKLQRQTENAGSARRAYVTKSQMNKGLGAIEMGRSEGARPGAPETDLKLPKLENEGGKRFLFSFFFG